MERGLDHFKEAVPVFEALHDRSRAATLLSNIGVTEADLSSLNASFMDPIKFANLIAESSVATF